MPRFSLLDSFNGKDFDLRKKFGCGNMTTSNYVQWWFRTSVVRSQTLKLRRFLRSRVFDIFVEQVNREEKSYGDWTNPYVLEKIDRGEKDKTVSFQSTNKESMVGQIVGLEVR